MRPLLILIIVATLLPLVPADAGQPAVRVAEFVAAAQLDHNEDGRVTASDEFVELHNLGATPVDLAGWRILLNDTTPEALSLSGLLPPGARRAWVNPPGEQNNNGHLALLDPTGALVDEVRYGAWPGATLASAASTGAQDESWRLVEGAWSRGHATPDAAPLGPFVRHAPPFVATADGTRWAAAGVDVAWLLQWTDADRAYTEALVEAHGTHGIVASRSTPNASSGQSQAHGTIRTPPTGFDWRWVLRDASGREWSSPNLSVRVDDQPPPEPVLEAPAWTNLTRVPARARIVSDAGVGGVEYALEAVNETVATLLRDWSPSADFDSIDTGNATSLRWRALARDALGHSVAGPLATIRIDRVAPAAPTVSSTGGYDRVRLEWVAPADDASGADAVLVRRVEPSVRAWRVPADQSSWEDASFRPGDRLAYEVRVQDRAGNVGNATRVDVAYEGERPHVRGLRVSKSTWGATSLRVHADFDRPMDATRDAQVRIDGERRRGRWLANHSTYLVELDAYEGPPRASVALRVEAAWDTAGRALWSPLERLLPADGAPPTLYASDRDGWVNASGLTLSAADGNAPAHVRYRLGDEDGWREANASILVPIPAALRVRAHAVDAAAWRSHEIDRAIRLDASPPELGTPTLVRGRLHWPVTDEGSGVAAVQAYDASTRTPLPARLSGGGLVADVLGAPSVDIVVTDHVGNERTSSWSPPVPDAGGQARGHGENQRATARAASVQAPEAAEPFPIWGPLGTGAATVVGLASTVGAVRARRRRARPSLAKRLRRLRATRRPF